MPRLGLRKLREQTADYLPGAKCASSRRRLSELFTLDDHAFAGGIAPFVTVEGRTTRTINRLGLRRIWRAINGESVEGRRARERKARRAAKRLRRRR